MFKILAYAEPNRSGGSGTPNNSNKGNRVLNAIRSAVNYVATRGRGAYQQIRNNIRGRGL